MAYEPYDRNPSGIVFFGPTAADQVYESDSSFIYNSGTQTLTVYNEDVTNDLSVGNDFSVTGNSSFTGDVTVYGDLNVSGVVNQVNTTNLLVEDVEITLRSGFTGTPDAADDASIIVNRGAATDAKITWDEGSDDWMFDYAGTGPYSIIQHIIPSGGLAYSDNNKQRTIYLDISTLSSTATSINNTDLVAIDDGTSTKKITYANFVNGLGVMSNFAASGDAGAAQTISDGDTLLIAGGNGLATDSSATDTITINFDLGDGNLTSVAPVTGDSFLTLDSDGSTHQLTTVDNLATLFAGNGLTASSAELSVNVDNSTLTIDTDTVKVADGGIDTTQLADGAVTEAKRERTITDVSANSTIAHDITLVTTGASEITVTLPAATSGKVIVIKKKDSGSGNVKIVGATHDSVTDTIDGADNKRLYYIYESMTCVAKNTGISTDQQAWYII